jgi:hypothetical protein
MALMTRITKAFKGRVRKATATIGFAELAALAAGVKTYSKDLAPADIPPDATVIGYVAKLSAEFVGVTGLVGDIGDDTTPDGIAADLDFTSAAANLVPATGLCLYQTASTFAARVDGGANDLNTATAGAVEFVIWYVA